MPLTFPYMKTSYNKQIGVIDLNHAIVFAAQQFLGFELCDALLEKGWTVTAIDKDNEMKDKWLEIGRNANLQYVPYGDWDKDLQPDTAVFLPYYDQVRDNKVSYLSEVETLLSKMDQPIQMIRIYSNGSMEQGEHSNGAVFYLPTLYGIHQPEEFLFAQLLAGRERVSEYVDDPSGAIYVKDAARMIISLSSKEDRYSLKSLSSKSWNEALTYITNESFSNDSRLDETVGKEVIVKPSKSHKSIIEEQVKWIQMHENQE